MTSTTWQIGNLVRLKSGGPTMTVANVGVGIAGDEVACTWFDGKKRLEDTFPPDALELVTSRAPRIAYAVTRKGL